MSRSGVRTGGVEDRRRAGAVIEGVDELASLVNGLGRGEPRVDALGSSPWANPDFSYLVGFRAAVTHPSAEPSKRVVVVG